MKKHGWAQRGSVTFIHSMNWEGRVGARFLATTSNGKITYLLDGQTSRRVSCHIKAGLRFLTNSSTHAQIYTLHIHIYSCTYIYTFTHTIHIIHNHIHSHICILTYIYIYIHSHIHKELTVMKISRWLLLVYLMEF